MCVPAEHFAEFIQFEIILDENCQLYGQYVLDTEDLNVGQLVLVDCTDTTGHWRRGQVSRIDRLDINELLLRIVITENIWHQWCEEVFLIDS